MKKSIYIRLVRYFIGLILVTCLASAGLFLVTIGGPVAREAHQLVRNHVRFIAEQIKALPAQEDSRSLEDFLRRTGRAYGIDLAVFNADLTPIAHFSVRGTIPEGIRPEMLRAVEKQGRWVQSGHFSGRTAYLLPLTGRDGTRYLYLAKPSATLGPLVLFLSGLVLLCLLLILAIYPLARSFTGPIERLSGRLEEMAAGKFDGEEIIPEREDELGRLEQTYTRMAASVNQMMASKKRLLADISHELRSPLARMEVSAELLTETCEEKGDDQGLRQAAAMASEIYFMAGLVRALSEYSRINLPEFRLEKSKVSPEELVRDLSARNRDIMEREGIRLNMDLEAGLPQIRLDRDRIGMVLQNFLDNARQHTPAGGEILIGALCREDGVSFFVSDPGPGVPPGFEDRIFEPLFRADASRNRNTGGLGLGLAISRRITTLHGGKIRHLRRAGRTIFSIDIK